MLINMESLIHGIKWIVEIICRLCLMFLYVYLFYLLVIITKWACS